MMGFKGSLGIGFGLRLSLAFGLSLGIGSNTCVALGADSIQPQSTLDYRELGLTPIQSGGRIKPLDSFAREAVIFVTGARSFGGFEPLDLLLSWVKNPEEWKKVPLIRIPRKDLLKQLLLDETRTKFAIDELIGNPIVIQYVENLRGQQAPQAAPMGGAPQQSQREQELRKVVQRVDLFRSITTGEAWTLVPSLDRVKPWTSIASEKGSASEILKGFEAVIRAYLTVDAPGFAAASQGLRQAVEKRVPTYSDSEKNLVALESFYNRLRPFYVSMAFYFLAALLWTVAIRLPKLSPLAMGSTVVALGFHVFGFFLRMKIAGRPPVSNMYESIIWVSFGIYLFAMILYAIHRQKVIPAVASFLSTFCLLAADASPAIMDPMIHPLVPVLRSNYWLTIHVLTITLGYAAFALSLGLANVSLWFFAKKSRAPQTRQNHYTQKITAMNLFTYRAIQFGVVLLAAGTILGGVWADYSWGRFWGWDPKEVWALIALLCYVAILHARFTGWMGQMAFAAWAVVAFLSVVMAWYGVNFVLGVGLHSYGFSSGGGYSVATFCALQLAYVGVVVGLYRKSRPRILFSS